MANFEIIKKDGRHVPYNAEKIQAAVSKSASRVGYVFTDDELFDIVEFVEKRMARSQMRSIPVKNMHNYVEAALDTINPKVAKSYRDYRNWKEEWAKDFGSLFDKANKIMYIGDKENANADSALTSTKRSLIYNELNKMLYRRTFMTEAETAAFDRGLIWIHDMNSRRDCVNNCCLCDMEAILTGGFEMGNVWYNEPKSLDTAFDVIGDVVLSAASQQYGGFTVPEVDTLLEKYAIISYDKYRLKHLDEAAKHEAEYHSPSREDFFLKLKEALKNTEPGEDPLAEEVGEYEEGGAMYVAKEAEVARAMSIINAEATEEVRRDLEQGFQGWEYKFNTVGSSRGDYPFITITFGLNRSKFGKMASLAALKVRETGQGKPGFKKPVLFPKLVFLYDENLHGPGKELEDVFEAGVSCSSATMYPDWLSLTGDGYVASIYKKYGKVISPMGCVSGGTRVKYSIGDDIIETTFQSFWNNTSLEYSPKRQFKDTDEFLYIEPQNISIYDNKEGKFVHVSKIIRNTSENWLRIRTDDHHELTCTTDHPMTTAVGIDTKACALSVGEEILVSGPDGKVYPSRIVEMTRLDRSAPDFSYDVETETSHFEADGIYSHNCRAFLSPWFERGGESPADDEDEPVFIGRFNIGAVSLNLPLIYLDAKHENVDFYQKLDEILELIRNIHKRTYEYIGEMRASLNPLMCCEGGFYGGHLGYHDKVAPILKSATASFGITALNELQEAYNGKSIAEDGQFAIEVMEHINEKVAEFKKEDGWLYAIYGTPAENLCLAKGSLVRIGRGNTRPIEDIEVGDFVESYDATTGKVVLSQVIDKHLTSVDASLVKVHIKNGGVITCTPDHILPILKGFTEENGSMHLKLEDVEAGALTPGTDLLGISGGSTDGAPTRATVDFVEFISETSDVYDITVDGTHNFFVATGDNNKAVLVHNCGRQVDQIRTAYGVIPKVSDKPYVSNSFHCHVSEQLSPIEKQDLEGRFWDLCNGGKIQYVRYPTQYNTDAVRSLVRRAMGKGFYEGVNMSLSYCDDCGHQELDMDVCPKCGSRNLTKIDRMNGYLAYSRVKGDSRLADHKMAEIKDRVSM